MADQGSNARWYWLRRLRKYAGWLLAALALLLPVTLFPLLFHWQYLPISNVSISWYASLAIFFGELVGFSEITTRYRDEPLRAIFNRFGISYLLVNGFLSGCAFVLMRSYGDKILPGARDPFLSAVVAGFGAMIILRSKLFVFRTDEGKEIPIGPDLVIASILRIMDRKIDRLRAARRQQLVFELAKRIASAAGTDPSFDNPNGFVLISLASFQNLSTEEKQQITETANQLQEKFKSRPTLFKAMILGFVVLDIAGEENLSAIMQDLEEYLWSTHSIVPATP